MSMRSVASPTISPPQEKDSEPQPPQDSDAAARERAETIQRKKAEIWDWLMASFAEEEKNVERMRRETGMYFAKRDASECIRRLFDEKNRKQCRDNEDEEGNISASTDDDMEKNKRKRAKVHITFDEVIISSGDTVPKKKKSS